MKFVFINFRKKNSETILYHYYETFSHKFTHISRYIIMFTTYIIQNERVNNVNLFSNESKNVNN